MASLEKDCRCTLDLEKDMYTWKSANGCENKLDHLLVVDIVVSPANPYY
jgi:hypothetical protein